MKGLRASGLDEPRGYVRMQWLGMLTVASSNDTSFGGF